MYKISIYRYNIDISTSLVATDKTWIRDFEPELKSQSMEWKEKGLPRTAKFLHQLTKVKQLVSFMYDYDGELVCDRVTPQTNVDGA